MSEWKKHDCLCVECGHRWIGMVCDRLAALECPRCHTMGGRTFIEQHGGWDSRYLQLEKGQLVEKGDEVDICSDGWRDNPLWIPAIPSIGERAPDPCYPSHRKYRRLINKE